MATKSSVKNILILGTVGAGKFTLVKNILDHMYMEQEQRTEGENHTWVRKDARITQCSGTLEDTNCTFFLVDTADPGHRQNYQAIYTRALEYLHKFAQDGLSMIILLVRQGCCTPPDLEKLDKIVENFFTEKSKSITTLIHSGCDGFSEEAKEKYIESFEKSGGEVTRKLAEYSCNKALCISFPNIGDGIDPFLVECYKASIKESKETLTNLILGSSEPIAIENLLKVKSEGESFFKLFKQFCICL